MESSKKDNNVKSEQLREKRAPSTDPEQLAQDSDESGAVRAAKRQCKAETLIEDDHHKLYQLNFHYNTDFEGFDESKKKKNENYCKTVLISKSLFSVRDGLVNALAFLNEKYLPLPIMIAHKPNPFKTVSHELKEAVKKEVKLRGSFSYEDVFHGQRDLLCLLDTLYIRHQDRQGGFSSRGEKCFMADIDPTSCASAIPDGYHVVRDFHFMVPYMYDGVDGRRCFKGRGVNSSTTTDKQTSTPTKD